MPLAKKQVSHLYLGLGKTIYNGNLTELEVYSDGSYSWQTLLQERFTRKKWSGQWPLNLLEHVQASKKDYRGIAENRDITTPFFIEELYQKESLFYELLKKKELEKFCSALNDELEFIPHHIAHAFSAVAQMPFVESFIVVMDGGGNKESETQKFLKRQQGFPVDIDDNYSEINSELIVHTSIFLWKNNKLSLLYREGLSYEAVSGLGDIKISQGIGSAYEKAAQLIFNDNLASGKVMGLAGFGRSFFKEEDLQDLKSLQSKFPWECRFRGNDKKSWQESPHMKQWQDTAATIQEAFEMNLAGLFKRLDEYDGSMELPLVLTGGCALNCTANYKIWVSQKRSFYVPPNPGDEGISLGLAFLMALKDGGISFFPRPYESQGSAFGPLKHEHKNRTQNLLNEITLEDFSLVAKLLEKNMIVAWFQGRSECGPRSLGQRSLLVAVDRPQIKNYLNEHIKFREGFRPYGASVLWEKAHLFFDIEKGFQNPFMSFATPIRNEYRDLLREVCHVDGTCRMQTVMREQNPAFHELLSSLNETLPILLNTSLNIMGEPIVETEDDALKFLKNSQVDVLVLNKRLLYKDSVRDTIERLMGQER